jgi:serine/threonine protein kinase/tetratricopeptide (TPR) repeat protein
MNSIRLDEEAIFHVARRIQAAEARGVYLEQVCGQDRGLRDRMDALLRVYEQEQSFLEEPPIEPGAPPSVDVPPLAEGPGTVIGPYKLLEPIGEGGMGVVYMAEQMKPVRRKLALKIIKPGMDTKQVIARFEAERQALALMDHPNIARVLDAGAIGSGRPYFVMELVKGIPITDYCDRNRLVIEDRLVLFAQICQAVQHAHQKGIIHRDLKPSNVLVTLIDGAAVPKVIDFGVAKAMGQQLTEKTLFTGFAQLIGTPLYMSPEQAEFSGVDVDTRSDIYELGVLLYELLTGTTPFDAETFRTAAYDEIRRIIREEEPPKPSTRISTLEAVAATVSSNRKSDPRSLGKLMRGELDWIVMKALEKDRNRRYDTANALVADLRRYLGHEPVEAGPPSTWYRLRKAARRNRTALVAAAVVATALVAGTAVSTWQAIKAIRAEEAARAEVDKATEINDFLIGDLLLRAFQASNSVSDRIKLEEVLDQDADRVGLRFHARPLLEAGLRSTIGYIYNVLGATDKSRRQYALALKIYQREKGPWAVETANAMIGLGTALHREGHLSEAETLMRPAVDNLHRTLGVEHRDTLFAMLRLARLCESLGKLAEAETLTAQVLEVSRRVLGEEHLETLKAMTSLARYYIKQGKLSQAEPLALEAHELFRRLRGEEAVLTNGSRELVAWLYGAQGELSEAEQPALKVLEGCRRVQGERHEETLRVINFLASLYLEQGKLHEAERVLYQATANEQVSDSHDVSYAYQISLVKTYCELGAVLEQTGQFKEVEQAYRKAMAVSERLVAERPDQPEAQNNLAWFLATCPVPQLRDPARAVELARSVVEKMPEKAAYWNTVGANLYFANEQASYWGTLGVALYRAGDWKASVEALGKSTQLAERGNGCDWFFLAMAHWRLGHRIQARSWYDRAVAWMDKIRLQGEELKRFRAEAASLLGVHDMPPEVFARPEAG